MESGPAARPERIGPYWMFGAFARGGMASIHLGRLVGPAGFSRLVALKLLQPQLADDEHYAMLLDEARLSSRVRHANVVQTLDVVQDAGRLCIVIQYVHGLDLATLVSTARARGERTPPAVATAIVSGVLRGLHAAHEARSEEGRPLGLVHRDVSPQNVVVGDDGVARVLDFGIAKALRRDQVTMQGQVKGRVAYIAPEQLVGNDVTRQADVYSAGVVLWEALTGRHLFDEPSDVALATRVLEGRVDPPSTAGAEVSPGLDDIVLRAVASDRRDRFATALEMAEALDEALPPATSEEVAAWLRRIGGGALEARASQMREVETFEEKPSARPGTPTRRWPPLAIAVSSAVMVGAALAVVLVVGRGHAAAPPADSGQTAASVAPAAMPTPSMNAAPPAPPDPSVASSAVDSTTATTGPTRPPAHAGRAVHAPSCDPPFVIDDKGVKHYKAACLK